MGQRPLPRAHRVLGKEHVGVEPAVTSSRGQHSTLVADGGVVHDSDASRRSAASDLIRLRVPHHTHYAGVGGGIDLCSPSDATV